MNQRADDLFILETLRHCYEAMNDPYTVMRYSNLALIDDAKRAIKILEDRKK